MARKYKKKRSGNKTAKIILFAVEAVILVGLLTALHYLRDVGKPENGGLVKAEFKDEDIKMNNEQVKDNAEVAQQLKGYRNIALFGVDSTAGALTKNTRSDSIIIASVNMDTGEVKLVSVYRDTFLKIEEDEIDEDTGKVKEGRYKKCNSAYMYGGAKQAMEMLNLNLDLNITDFVTVGFAGLKEAVDALGGVWIDIDPKAIVHMNNYQFTMAESLDCEYTPITESGYQLLDGLQAVAYCRVRYGGGDDFRRAERQREVIQALVEQAKKAKLQDLIDAVNAVASSKSVYMSFDVSEILELVPLIADYQIVDESGFPFTTYRGTATLGTEGSCVLTLDLEKNVQELHKFLFGTENYQVSDVVAAYSQVIRDKVAKYEPNMKYPE